MQDRCLSVLLLMVITAVPARGQVISAPDPVVEVIGLEKWTLRMLTDSLQKYVPGTTLADGACAVILRDSIGFGQAAVQTMQYGTAEWITVTVVEPGRAKYLGVRTNPDSIGLRPEWTSIRAALDASVAGVSALQDYGFMAGRSNLRWGEAAEPGEVAIRDAVRLAAEMHGDSLALWTLENDRSRENRVAAALILGHFADRASTWHALMRALRGKSDFAASMADMTLSTLARSRPMEVDWSRSVEDLSYLLAGTNLFAYLTVLNVLHATGVDREIARSVIAPGALLLEGNLRSRNPSRVETVRRFLLQASRTDFGDDNEKWAHWVRAQ